MTGMVHQALEVSHRKSLTPIHAMGKRAHRPAVLPRAERAHDGVPWSLQKNGYETRLSRPDYHNRPSFLVQHHVPILRHWGIGPLEEPRAVVPR